MRNTIFAFALICCSCIAEFKNPITEKFVTDNRIVGSWSGQMNDDEVLLTITRSKGKTYLLKGMSKDKKGDDKIGPLTFKISKLGKQKYWNLLVKDPDADISAYTLVHYKINSSRLSLRAIDTEEVMSWIESKKIKGTVTKRKFFSRVQVTASSKELQTKLPSLLENDSFGETSYFIKNSKHH